MSQDLKPTDGGYRNYGLKQRSMQTPVPRSFDDSAAQGAGARFLNKVQEQNTQQSSIEWSSAIHGYRCRTSANGGQEQIVLIVVSEVTANPGSMRVDNGYVREWSQHEVKVRHGLMSYVNNMGAKPDDYGEEIFAADHYPKNAAPGQLLSTAFSRTLYMQVSEQTRAHTVGIPADASRTDVLKDYSIKYVDSHFRLLGRTPDWDAAQMPVEKFTDASDWLHQIDTKLCTDWVKDVPEEHKRPLMFRTVEIFELPTNLTSGCVRITGFSSQRFISTMSYHLTHKSNNVALQQHDNLYADFINLDEIPHM